MHCVAPCLVPRARDGALAGTCTNIAARITPSCAECWTSSRCQCAPSSFGTMGQADACSGCDFEFSCVLMTWMLLYGARLSQLAWRSNPAGENTCLQQSHFTVQRETVPVFFIQRTRCPSRKPCESPMVNSESCMRSVASQSQCTYNRKLAIPRFAVLPDSVQG